jgi:hypothetical protein
MTFTLDPEVAAVLETATVTLLRASICPLGMLPQAGRYGLGAFMLRQTSMSVLKSSQPSGR